MAIRETRNGVGASAIGARSDPGMSASYGRSEGRVKPRAAFDLPPAKGVGTFA
jgi:hypothetical protein